MQLMKCKFRNPDSLFSQWEESLKGTVGTSALASHNLQCYLFCYLIATLLLGCFLAKYKVHMEKLDIARTESTFLSPFNSPASWQTNPAFTEVLCLSNTKMFFMQYLPYFTALFHSYLDKWLA